MTDVTFMDAADVRTAVSERYAAAAKGGGCCGSSASSSCFGDAAPADPSVGVGYYSADEVAGLEQDVATFSLGCGNPIAFAKLEPGETVLDLGSGGGLDCFISSKFVGPTGHVIGVDMTPAMLERARNAAERMGIPNVEFREGLIEALPVADNSVDLIISNCVINLSPDKDAVFREAFRVLKPGGRLVVSDIVTSHDLPPVIKRDLELWAGCIAGALPEGDYTSKMAQAGFEQVEPLARSTYVDDEMAQKVPNSGPHGPIYSLKVRAYKPLSS